GVSPLKSVTKSKTAWHAPHFQPTTLNSSSRPVRGIKAADAAVLRGHILGRKMPVVIPHIIEKGDHDAVFDQHALELRHGNQGWRLPLRVRQDKRIRSTLAHMHPSRLDTDGTPTDMAR